MRYYSTRDLAGATGAATDLKTALLTGLASDGGLYLPTQTPHVPSSKLRQWRRGSSFADIAADLAIAWFGDDVAAKILRAIAYEAYDFPVPIVRTGDGTCCELFHGPSLSFKDFAAQLLLRLLDHLLARDNERALILTATSGDTGGAVAAACHGRKRLRAVILYPKGRISTLQEKQIATWGDNIHAVAVEGTFDDCQRLVKEALGTYRPVGLHVTSANSINIGRLLPQTFYYWYAALQVAQEGEVVTFVVPSGNFGNLTAGVLAKRMGAPIAHFVAATNVNDSVPRFLTTGRYEPAATRHTLSNAMDVGDPSNFERLQHLYQGAEPRLHGGDIEAMRAEITGIAVDDATTRATMQAVYQQHKYFLDPHTAVAWSALEQFLSSHTHIRAYAPTHIIFSTASPAKFPEIVRDATGTTPPVPRVLAECLKRRNKSNPLRATTSVALVELLDRVSRPA